MCIRDRLLGAHIIGTQATELIGELVMAKYLEATIEDLAYTIHAHPTLSESIMEAALDALGIPVHHWLNIFEKSFRP